MPIPIKSLLENKSSPVTVTPDVYAARAIEVMTEGDFSQLPVVDATGKIYGLITADSILHAVKLFKSDFDTLRVRDCYTPVKTYRDTADIFEVLQGLKENLAVLIVSNQDGTGLHGILTDFDTASFFQKRAQSAMLVEEIEGLLKEFIGYSLEGKTTAELGSAIAKATLPEFGKPKFKKAISCYTSGAGFEGDLNPTALESAFEVLTEKGGENERGLSDLTFAEMTLMFLSSDRWDSYAQVINLPAKSVQEMLDAVRRIRNKISHFKGDVSRTEHQALVKCEQWLRSLQPGLQSHFGDSQEKIAKEIESQSLAIQAAREEGPQAEPTGIIESEVRIWEPEDADIDYWLVKKHSALARWLQGVPGEKETTWTSFSKFELLVGFRLPRIAYEQRSWWANDYHDESPAQLWLEAGWEQDAVNLETRQVRFRRAN